MKTKQKTKEMAEKKDLEEVRVLLNKAKTALVRLTPKSVRVLEKAMEVYLDTGNGAREAIGAANTALKAVGLNEEGERQSDTQITVVLPSGVESRIIDISPDNESGAV